MKQTQNILKRKRNSNRLKLKQSSSRSKNKFSFDIKNSNSNYYLTPTKIKTNHNKKSSVLICNGLYSMIKTDFRNDFEKNSIYYSTPNNNNNNNSKLNFNNNHSNDKCTKNLKTTLKVKRKKSNVSYDKINKKKLKNLNIEIDNVQFNGSLQYPKTSRGGDQITDKSEILKRHKNSDKYDIDI